MSAIPVTNSTTNRTSQRETEGGRFGPTGVSLCDERATNQPLVPNSEVPVSPARRRLTAAYKLRILNLVEEERRKGNGALGAFLRGEGLYYSSIQNWQRQLNAGLLGANQRGAKQKGRDTLLRENRALRRQLESVKKKLHKTELIVDLQKKISEMLSLDSSEPVLKHGKTS
jgi:hypothetical protein